MKPTALIWGDTGMYENYVRAIEAAGGRVCITRSETTVCDALLLPGGGDVEPWRYGQIDRFSAALDPERDEAELMLLRRFTGLRKPVLGICRGVQIINVFFGGTLRQDLPGHSAEKGKDRMHAVQTVPSFLRDICGEICTVNSAHHQAVDIVGAGLRPLQWAADGTVEALCHDLLPIWGLQWHPERLPGELGGCVFKAFLSMCKA